MKISYPPGVLVTDVSKWDDHLNIQELLDGGVVSVILGLYKQWSKAKNKYVLHDNCQRIGEQVAASSLILQSYYYYYPELDPLKEADWFIDTMFTSGFPFKFAWADCENHDVDLLPKLRSEQYRRFTAQLHSGFPQKTGVYTNKGFITSWAPEMDLWVGKYPSWVAHYGRQPAGRIMVTWEQLKTYWLPNYEIILSKGQLVEKVMGHQFSDRFILPGAYCKYAWVPGWTNKGRLPLDVSVFKAEFIQSLGGTIIPPVPPPAPIPVSATHIITGGNPNVRSSPSALYPSNIIGMLKRDDRITVDIPQPYWVHFIPMTGYPVGGWVSTQFTTKLS